MVSAPLKFFEVLIQFRAPEGGPNSQIFFLISRTYRGADRGGGGSVNKKLRELKEQLLFRIDPDDLLEVDKVNRYIKLRELDAACDKAIKRDGATIVIENGSQKFIKAHPAMNEKSKLNSQMIALEKSINFTNGNLVPSSSSPAASVEGKKGDYEPGDLV
jgi:hypothetical protein